MRASKQNPGSNSKQKGKSAPTSWRERMSPEDYEHLRDVFLIFDEDGSGKIDPEEVVKVLEEIGIGNRNPHVMSIVVGLRETNKILTFEEFVEVVGTKIGENRTRDGIERIFNLYDAEGNGRIGFEQLKHVARSIGETMTDDELLDLMHAIFIKNGTESNQSISFDEFYQVISQYYQHH